MGHHHSCWDLPRLRPLFFIALCDKNIPLFLWMPSSWWRLWGCWAHKEWRIQVLALLQRVPLVFPPEQWSDVLQDGSHVLMVSPIIRGFGKRGVFNHFTSQNSRPCSALPSPSVSGKIFLLWSSLMTNCNQCKIAAGSAPRSPQSIDVHWFIYFFHCCLFSSPKVAVCSIILELKSKISEANYSGLLTQVARNHE